MKIKQILGKTKGKEERKGTRCGKARQIEQQRREEP